MSQIFSVLEKVCSFFSKTFALFVIIFALFSYFNPGFFAFLAAYIPILLGIAMFGMGLTLSPKDFSEILKRPLLVILGIAGQFVIMPALAFALVLFLNLPNEIAAGVMLVGCCPGGTSSNVMTYLGKGDVPLSVTITACTTVMAPFVTPALFYVFASQWIEISPYAMFVSILQIVLLPIVLGVAVNLLFKKTVAKASVCLPVISGIAIIGIVVAVVSVNSDRLSKTGLLIFAVVMLHNCIGYFLGYMLGLIFRLKLPQKKTMAIEVGMQNSGLAVALSQKVLADPIAAVPGAIFSVWHNISGPIAATIFANMSKNKNSDKL